MINDGIRINLSLGQSNFEAGLQAAQKQVESFRDRVNRLVSTLSLGAFGGAFGIGALGVGIKTVFDSIVGLNREARQFGMTVEQLQAFRRVASEAGRDSEFAGKKLGDLGEKIGQALSGESGAIKLFDKYGIAIYTAEGRARSLYDVLLDLTKLLQKTSNADQRNAIISSLLGGGADDLGPILAEGPDALERRRKTAGVKTAQAKSVSRLSDWFRRAKESAIGFGSQALLGLFGQTEQDPRILISDENGRRWESLEKTKAPDANPAITSLLTDKRNKAEFGRLTAAGKVMAVEQEIADVRAEADKLADDAPAKAMLLAKIEEKRVELAKLESDFKDKAQDRDDKSAANSERIVQNQERLNELRRQRATMAGDMATSSADRYRFSLEEIAGGNPANAWAAQQVMRARRVQYLEQFGRRAGAVGRYDIAQQAFGTADIIRQSIEALKSGERAPQLAMQRSLEQIDRNIADVTRAIVKLGGVVRDDGE